MLYLIPFLHQTTTLPTLFLYGLQLYLIPFLHQTTTTGISGALCVRLYLIPFLHQTTTRSDGISNTLTLYLIPFLHQTTTLIQTRKFQPWLYLIPFLHQTTTSCAIGFCFHCCILFHFYIKPQRRHEATQYVPVVSYSISTSNHNLGLHILHAIPVVSYSISTSNHNYSQPAMRKYMLYLIPFLHQTTTCPPTMKTA